VDSSLNNSLQNSTAASCTSKDKSVASLTKSTPETLNIAASRSTFQATIADKMVPNLKNSPQIASIVTGSPAIPFKKSRKSRASLSSPWQSNIIVSENSADPLQKIVPSLTSSSLTSTSTVAACSSDIQSQKTDKGCLFTSKQIKTNQPASPPISVEPSGKKNFILNNISVKDVKVTTSGGKNEAVIERNKKKPEVETFVNALQVNNLSKNCTFDKLKQTFNTLSPVRSVQFIHKKGQQLYAVIRFNFPIVMEKAMAARFCIGGEILNVQRFGVPESKTSSASLSTKSASKVTENLRSSLLPVAKLEISTHIKSSSLVTAEKKVLENCILIERVPVVKGHKAVLMRYSLVQSLSAFGSINTVELHISPRDIYNHAIVKFAYREAASAAIAENTFPSQNRPVSFANCQ